MKHCRYLIFFFIVTLSAYAGTDNYNTQPIVKNIAESLNYNRYDNFLQNGSLKWRKSMNRSRYNKMRAEMLSYIGHIVGWKFVSVHRNGKIHNYIYKLFGENEAISLFMELQVYKNNGSILVNNIVFSKR